MPGERVSLGRALATLALWWCVGWLLAQLVAAARDEHTRAVAWYALMRACYGVSERVGALGIQAENRYRQAIH